MTRRGGKQRPWSEAEKRQLAELYVAQIDVVEIARRLGRPVEGLKSKAAHMGLRRKAKGTWTDTELAALNAEYEACGHPRELAAKLGRPVRSVMEKASQLGLYRPNKRPWTPEEDEIVRRGHAEGRSLVEIADMVGRRYTTVAKRSSKALGLRFPQGPTRRRNWTAEDDEAIRAAHAAGRTLASVAAKIGRNYSSARQRARCLGLDFQIGPSFARGARPAAAENGDDTRSPDPAPVGDNVSDCGQPQVESSSATPADRREPPAGSKNAAAGLIECLRVAAMFRKSEGGILALAERIDQWAGRKDRALRLEVLAIAAGRHGDIKDVWPEAHRFAEWAGLDCGAPAGDGTNRNAVLGQLERVIGDVCGVRPEILRGYSRRQLHVVPRSMFSWLAHEHAGASHTEIARWLGNRDHTSVAAAVKRFEGQRTAGPISSQLCQVADRLGWYLPGVPETASESGPAAPVTNPDPAPTAAPPEPLPEPPAAAKPKATCTREKAPKPKPPAAARPKLDPKREPAPAAAPKPGSAPKAASGRRRSTRTRDADKPLTETEERVLRTIIREGITGVARLGSATGMPAGPMAKVLEGLRRKEYLAMGGGALRVERLPSGNPIPRGGAAEGAVRIIKAVAIAAPEKRRRRPRPPIASAPADLPKVPASPDRPAMRRCLGTDCGRMFESRWAGERLCPSCRNRNVSDETWMGGSF